MVTSQSRRCPWTADRQRDPDTLWTVDTSLTFLFAASQPTAHSPQPTAAGPKPQKPKTQNPEPKTQNPKPKTQNPKPEKLVQVRCEISIMSQLDHPNILRLFEYFETEHEIFLILDLCKGGELLDRLHEQTDHRYNERTACKLIFTMLSAVRYCHAHNIVHRDLKLYVHRPKHIQLTPLAASFFFD